MATHVSRRFVIQCDHESDDKSRGCTYQDEYVEVIGHPYLPPSLSKFQAACVRKFRKMGWKVGKHSMCPQCKCMVACGLDPFNVDHQEKYCRMSKAAYERRVQAQKQQTAAKR